MSDRVLVSDVIRRRSFFPASSTWPQERFCIRTTALLKAGEDSTDPRRPDRPYLIIQRQFETPDGGQCCVETHDHGYVGHFTLRLTVFTRTCLAFEIARKHDTPVEVSCSLGAVEFKELERIVNIIFDQHG